MFHCMHLMVVKVHVVFLFFLLHAFMHLKTSISFFSVLIFCESHIPFSYGFDPTLLVTAYCTTELLKHNILRLIS